MRRPYISSKMFAMSDADIAALHREHLEEKARIKRIQREVEIEMAKEETEERIRKQLEASRGSSSSSFSSSLNPPGNNATVTSILSPSNSSSPVEVNNTIPPTTTINATDINVIPPTLNTTSSSRSPSYGNVSQSLDFNNEDEEDEDEIPSGGELDIRYNLTRTGKLKKWGPIALKRT